MSEEVSFDWKKIISEQSLSSDDYADTHYANIEAEYSYSMGEQMHAPSMYELVIMKDGVTPMGFIVTLLRDVFNKPAQEAINLMMKVYNDEVASCGVYTRDVAETIMIRISEVADMYQYPFECIMRKEQNHAIK